MENYEDEGRGRVFFWGGLEAKGFHRFEPNRSAEHGGASSQPARARHSAALQVLSLSRPTQTSTCVLTRTSAGALGPQISLLLFLASRGAAARRETEECLGHSEPVLRKTRLSRVAGGSPAPPAHRAGLREISHSPMKEKTKRRDHPNSSRMTKPVNPVLRNSKAEEN
jgi:hypothetical protein